MKIFRQLNIAQRLKWLQIVLVVGLGIVALTYLLLTSLQASFESKTESLNEFSQWSQKANISLLQLRRHEKDFLARLDSNYIQQYDEEYENLTNIFSEMNKLAYDDMERNIVKSAMELSATYSAEFAQAAKAQIELGLTHELGLQGKLRTAIREVETLVNELDEVQLLSSVLMMRRHEKDFILRKEDRYVTQLTEELKKFTELLNASKISISRKQEIAVLADSYKQSFLDYVSGRKLLDDKVAKMRAAAQNTEPLYDRLIDISTQVKQETTAALNTRLNAFSILFFTLLIAVTSVTIYGLFFVTRTIRQSVTALGNTVKEISAGNYAARSNLASADELGAFARTFDNLLDERVSTLVKAESENEKLNNSIIDLMEAVSQLSDKDLTVRVRVAEDVTGPVADSLNLMANETAKVLADIQQIAQDVKVAAAAVQNQGGLVTDVAGKERDVVVATMSKLEESARTMTGIAKIAQSCNLIAIRAAESTGEALKFVSNTEQGMSGIRETISETEKRIKRLAERSQEITGIVEIINNISERTHVLALNASMQAAAAGDAGRGFAVVADEVQRLAESSRQSTSEIATLVKNIQTETAEAMTTMNLTIGQVVEGTKLAQRSAEQMMATKKTTEELSSTVAQIAHHSTKQAKNSTELLTDAKQIVESTEKTGVELNSQSEQTAHLVEYSQRLLDSVRVFRIA
jgi:twitching motility protein PilJ